MKRDMVGGENMNHTDEVVGRREPAHRRRGDGDLDDLLEVGERARDVAGRSKCTRPC
jgi:hypothetical protein